MLVYYYFPYGFTTIDNKRVYGYLEKHPAQTISWESYKANKKDLVLASYSKEILEKIFPNGGEFPDIRFTYAQIRQLTWEQVRSILKAIGHGATINQGFNRKKTVLKHILRCH